MRHGHATLVTSVTFLTDIVVLRSVLTTGQLCAGVGIRFPMINILRSSDGVPFPRSQCECEKVQVLAAEFDEPNPEQALMDHKESVCYDHEFRECRIIFICTIVLLKSVTIFNLNVCISFILISNIRGQ